MKLVGSMTAVTLACLVAVPGANARPRLGPGLILAPLAIVGGIAGAAVGSRRARAHRSYQHRPRVQRPRGAIRQMREVPARTEPVSVPAIPLPPEPARGAPAGWAGPLFWPHAYDGVFEYAFGLPGDDSQFWARGFGDVIDGMFMPPARDANSRGRRAQAASQRTWENLCGSEAPKAAEATVARIRQTAQPNEAQQAELGKLRAALLRATERIEGACPSGHASTPPERLRLMIARLTAMRQAVLAVQGPLRTFYDSLSDEQRAALERAGSEDDKANARAQAGLETGCAAPIANWPQQQIERVLQPNKAQRVHLERMRRTALGMAQFVASTCPKEVPRSAPERLDAVKDRLAVLRYAASNVSSAFEQFYASLSSEQKARFQSLPRDRRAERGR